MSKHLYFEDLTVGDVFASAIYRITTEAITRFAAEFDPQSFHLNTADAADLFFGGLTASGWHTAAITMRLLVESLPIAGGIVGAGMDEFRWPSPVWPEDTLQVQSEVLELRVSRSRADRGLAKFRTTTINQHGQAVQVLVANLIVQRRDPDVGSGTGA